MTYAFLLDASSCSGCKACQVACKDKNNLPLGMLWRHVYEISGGEWVQSGEAWTNTVFAYYLSISCNHCEHPKCAGVCPADAFNVRPDGIVLIERKKCIGCRYCAWACPYNAPQVDPSTGILTKCDLCHDNLDSGLPPACVTACPMRCLDLLEVGNPDIEDRGLMLWIIPSNEHPFPLSKLSRTEPRLVIKPHMGMNQVELATNVKNREESSPGNSQTTARMEIPLIIFTLLTQMAIGLFGSLFLIILFLGNKHIAMSITSLPLLAVGPTIMVALFGSIFHLGNPVNAWRALNHMRKSWLSREIFSILGFSGSWVILNLIRKFTLNSFDIWIFFAAFTAAWGLGALYCMQRVYQLRSAPGWNTIRTHLEFTVSTLGLGVMLSGTLLPGESPSSILPWIIVTVVISLIAALIVTYSFGNSVSEKLFKWRVGLILGGLMSAIIFLFRLSYANHGLLFVIFGFVLAEEIIGRWLFYSRRILGI